MCCDDDEAAPTVKSVNPIFGLSLVGGFVVSFKTCLYSNTVRRAEHWEDWEVCCGTDWRFAD